jgi:hypothetical protein
MPRLLGSLALAIGVMAGAAQLSAQTVVRVSVRDSIGRALPNADAVIRNVPPPREWPGSVFLFAGLAKGSYLLSVRAVGYTPSNQVLQVEDADTTDVVVRLARAPQQLDPVVTTASEADPISPRLRAFEERRRTGLGRFFTRSVLAEKEHSTLDNLLRSVTGIHLIRRPIGCGGGYALASGRGGQALEAQSWMACMGSRRGPVDVTFAVACYYAIYLDGMRLWTPGNYEPPNVQSVTIASLDAIEVYRGPSELPMQYQGVGNACGAILLWTRS